MPEVDQLLLHPAINPLAPCYNRTLCGANTLVFTCALGVIGVTSRRALDTLDWYDLVVWAALFYSTAAVCVFVHGRARGERFVRPDRWAVIAYLRALQRSQNATAADVPPEHLAEMDKPPEPPKPAASPEAPKK